MIIKWLLMIFLVIGVIGFGINYQLRSHAEVQDSKLNYLQNGRFSNPAYVKPQKNDSTWRILWRYFKEPAVDKAPSSELPVRRWTRQQLAELDPNQLHVIKLGHSSILLKINNEYWLIDPVFSLRASPFQFFGPKRFHATPITVEELPIIHRVLISHNHYDHLDKTTIKQLIAKTQQFLVPLGVDTDLQEWGVPPEKIMAFAWWQEERYDDIMVAFTPTKHFSGRALNDSGTTLWGSWVIKSSNNSLFFSGDSGYFDGFRRIGDKYGPFDLTMIETGAYSTSWPGVHMQPEQSVQTHLDLRGKMMLPIHNGTFDLAFHAWYEPLNRVSAIAKQRDVKITLPYVGEAITPGAEAKTQQWWRLN